jgi:hypothetical protein
VWPDDKPAANATTDANGRFVLALPANASYGRNYSLGIFAYKPGVGIAVADVDARFQPVPTLALKLQACAPVSMRVLDPAGELLQNAKVYVRGFGTSPGGGANITLPCFPPAPFATRTNARGEVTLDLIDPLGYFSLTVETPEYGVQMLSRVNEGSNSPLRLTRTGKLRGRLVADDPKMTSGALVRIMTIPVQRDDAMGQADVRTDAEGRFEVPAIVAGEVRVWWVEHAPASSLFLENEVKGTLQAGETLDIEVPVVRGVRVSGAVIQEESAKPLAAVPVHVSLNSGRAGTASWAVLTDKQGRYEVYVPPEAGLGFVQVGPLPALSMPAHTDRLSGEFPAAGNDLDMHDFVVKQGVMLTGTVVDADARPVALAHVQAAAVDGPARHYRRVLAETDANGKFSIGPIDADFVLALMAADDTRASPKVLAIEPWKTLGGIVLQVEESAMTEISGRIVDDAGKPIADVFISAGPEMHAGDWEYDAVKALQPISSLSERSDKQGKYVLPNRIPLLGRYYLQAHCGGYVGQRLVLDGSSLSPGGQSLEDLVLQRQQQK